MRKVVSVELKEKSKPELDVEILRSALVDLIGAETREQLLKMKAEILLPPKPEPGWVEQMNAINALLSTQKEVK